MIKALHDNQISVYLDVVLNHKANEEKNVCQMTRTLNNPAESSQDHRG